MEATLIDRSRSNAAVVARWFLVTALLACLLGLGIAPAHARWGQGRVDTWLRFGDQEVGHSVPTSTHPTLSVHLTPGNPRTVKWLITNLGGQPSTHGVGFHGCHSADGFGFRYFTPGGRQVSWKVTHNGFYYPSVAEGATRKLSIRLLAQHEGLNTTCVLEGTGLSGSDEVALHVWS
jgi:hypothetical protein